MSMKVVIHRYNSICEPDFIAAFQAIGLEVLEDRDEMTRKTISVPERMKVLGRLVLENRPLFVFTINFFPYIALLCEKLKVFYVAVSVDCPVAELFDESIRSPYNRIFLFDRQQYLAICDENPGHIFHLPLGVNVERIDRTIGSFEEWDRQAAAEAGNTDAPREGYAYDISFVGSLYNEKDEFAGLKLAGDEKGRLERLMERQQPLPGLSLLEEEITAQDVAAIKGADPRFYSSPYSVRDIERFWAIHLYLGDHLTSLDRFRLFNELAGALRNPAAAEGAGSGGSLADAPQSPQVHLFTRSDTTGLRGVICHGGVGTAKEMPEVFRRSRINLHTTMRAIRTGLPQRIWDILGSGGFLLSDAQEEIPEFLEIGKHLDVYEDTRELIDKTRYWLTHEEERRQIAMQGYLEVREHHTVIRRVTQMLRLILGE